MASKVNTQSFLSLLMCPVDRKPLTTAVNLFPCCHKVNQVVAEKFFGKIVDGFCEFKGKECFVCSAPVFSYTPDPVMRALTVRAFGHQDPKPKPLPTIALKGQQDAPNLLYPGIQAIFMCSTDYWDNPRDSSGNLCREIAFKSTTRDCLLSEFSLLGYKNGYVTIYVEYTHNSFREYLSSHGIVCDKVKSSYIATTHNEVKILFNIIALNNAIPREQSEKMIPIVILGKCPPLQETLQPPSFNDSWSICDENDLFLNSDCEYL